MKVNKLRLVSTQNLMVNIGIASYNTIQKLENAGIITPVKIGRLKKWNLDESIESIKAASPKYSNRIKKSVSNEA
jgi:hypothetical protein